MHETKYDPECMIVRAGGLSITNALFLELLCTEFSPHRQRSQAELIKFAPRIISSLNQSDRKNLQALISKVDAGKAVPPQDDSQYMQMEFSRQIKAGITNCGSDFERYPKDAISTQGALGALYKCVSSALIEKANKILPPLRASAKASSNYENPPQHLIPFE